jgi:hypothetical protein
LDSSSQVDASRPGHKPTDNRRLSAPNSWRVEASNVELEIAVSRRSRERPLWVNRILTVDEKQSSHLDEGTALVRPQVQSDILPDLKAAGVGVNAKDRPLEGAQYLAGQQPANDGALRSEAEKGQSDYY